MLQWAFQMSLVQPMGLECDLAADGAEAVAKVKQRLSQGRGPYLAVIMDNQMPNMTGCEAAEKMRSPEIGYTGLIIGITGDPSGSGDRTAFEQSGLDMCADKTAQGMKTIQEIVSNRRRSREAVSRRASLAGNRVGVVTQVRRGT